MLFNFKREIFFLKLDSCLETIAFTISTYFLSTSFRPHCMTALLDLIDLTTSLISKRSKAEECLTLNASLLKILSWLLKFFLAFIEASNRGQMSSSIVMKNAEKTFEILTDFYQDEFIFNLLYVTKVWYFQFAHTKTKVLQLWPVHNLKWILAFYLHLLLTKIVLKFRVIKKKQGKNLLT